MTPPAPLSSSVLWEILTPISHTRNRTLAAFTLCCRDTLFPELRDRYFFNILQRVWRLFKIFDNSPCPGYEDIHKNRYGCVRLAALAGKFELVKWLIEKWSLSYTEVHVWDYELLKYAADSKNAELVKWLVEKWPPTPNEIMHNWHWLARIVLDPDKRELTQLIQSALNQ